MPHDEHAGQVRAGRARRPTLAQEFDPRRNGLDVLRLVLAAVVALTHAGAIGYDRQPVLGSALLGDLAVDAFFVVSGFLVTRSYLRLGSLRRYAWHRFLRIAPAFWTCLLVTAFVAAPLVAHLEGRPATSVLTGERSAVDFVLRNWFLYVQQFDVGALAVPGGEDVVVNGALWTLFFEALCYGLVVALGVAGALTRRRWLVLAALAVLWACALATAAGVDLELPVVRRLVLMFLLGLAAHVFADRVPVDGRLAAVCLPLLAAGLWLTPDYRVLGGAALAYLLLWAGVRLRRPTGGRWDLSYGLYVYHWPVELVLASAGLATAGAAGVLRFAVVSLAVALLAATASWLLVERRALGAKDAAWVQAPLPRLRTGAGRG